jgi:hypothetical protein
MYQRSQPTPTQSPAPATTAEAPIAASNSEVLGGDVEAQFDTDGHRNVGDSVEGSTVTVNGVTFSPGEVAALVDYVGPPENLWSYDAATLAEMKQLIQDGCEDGAVWDRLTNGGYSQRARDNDDHFAPGEGDGPNFESSFVGMYAGAVTLMQQAMELGEDDPGYEALIAQSRAAGYGAEHYLQDSFSAGHQVSAEAVEAATLPLLDGIWFPAVIDGIAQAVFPREAEVIGGYEVDLGAGFTPIDQPFEFRTLLMGAGLYLGRDGVCDGVRKFVHEELDAGVEVASEAHPEPWVLHGDHGLTPEDQPDTWAALQEALRYARSQLDLAVIAGSNPTAFAQAVFDMHRPVPTGSGQRTIDDTLAAATANRDALVAACADAMCATIDDLMSGMDAQLPNVRKRGPTYGEVAATPSPAELAGAITG